MRSAVVVVLSGLVLGFSANNTTAQDAEWRAFADSGWQAARKGDLPAARELLGKARELADKFPAEDSRRSLTNAYLAYAISRNGDRKEADDLAKQAQAHFDRLPLEDPYRGKGYLALALTSVLAGRHDAADRQLRKAIESEEKLRGTTHLVVIQLVVNRAELLESNGRFEEAEPLRKRQVAALDVSGDPVRSAMAITAHRQTGVMYRNWNRKEQAISHFERAVELGRDMRLPEDQLAVHLTDLGELYLSLRLYDRAGPPLQEALKFRESALALRPAAEQADLARNLHAVGALFVAQGRFFPAEPILDRALDIREKAHPHDLRTAETLHVMAVGQTGQRSFRKAEKGLLRALQIRESLLGTQHLTVAATHEDLSAVYRKAGLADAAEASLLKAIEIREKTLGMDHPSVLDSLHALANLYRDGKRHEDAEKLYKRVIQSREKLSGRGPALPAVLDDYASLLKQINKLTEAAQLTARATAIRAKVR